MKHLQISFHKIYGDVQCVLMGFFTYQQSMNNVSNFSTLNETLDSEYRAISDIVNPCHITFVARVQEQLLILRFQTKRSKYAEFVPDFTMHLWYQRARIFSGLKYSSLI